MRERINLGRVLDIDWSLDGRFLLTAGSIIAIWDAQAPIRPVQVMNRHVSIATCARFSADGATVASGHADGRAVLWDSSNGKRRLTLPHQKDRGPSLIKEILISPDGSRVACWHEMKGSGHHTVVLADSLGRKLREIRGEVTTDLMALRFTADSRLLVCAYADRHTHGARHELDVVVLRRAETGQVERTLKCPFVNCLALSPDGLTLVTAGGPEIRLWSLAKGSLLATLEAGPQPGEMDRITDLAFVGGQELAAHDFDGVIRFWNLQTRVVVRETPSDGSGHRTLRGSAAWLAVLDRQTDRLRLVDSTNGFRETVASDCVFSPDGKRILTRGAGNSVRFGELASFPEMVELKGFSDRCTSLALSRDGRRLAVGDKLGLVFLFQGKEQIGRLELGIGQIRALLFTAGNSLIVAAGERGLVAAQVEGGSLMNRLEFPSGSPWMTSTPQGEVLVRQWPFSYVGPEERKFMADLGRPYPEVDPVVFLWDPRTGERRRISEEVVISAAYSPDGRWLAWARGDGSITLRDAKTGGDERRLEGHEVPVNSLTFSPDSSRLASRSRDRLLLWDVKSGATTHQAPEAGRVAKCKLGPDGPVLDDTHAGGMVFSPSGDVLTIPIIEYCKGHQWSQCLRVWEISSGLLGPMMKAVDPGNIEFQYIVEPVVAFSPNGSLLAWSGSARLWNVALGESALDLGHMDHLTGAAWTDDGRLATCSLDGTSVLWSRENFAVEPSESDEKPSIVQRALSKLKTWWGKE